MTEGGRSRTDVLDDVNRPVPDDERPGADMGAVYEATLEAGEIEDQTDPDAQAEPDAGDVFRSGS